MDFLTLSLSQIFIGLSTILTAMLVYKGIVIVGGEQIAVLERRWFGRALPRGRVVAMTNEIGIQARLLGPGLHLLIPFLYTVKKYPLIVIEENEVGLVDAIDGQPVAAGRIFGRAIEAHNLFQDGEAFLKHGGEKGPQISVLPPGTYRINPYLFKIEKAKAISIGNNHVGVVVANDGVEIDSGNLLGRHVKEHNGFQDGQIFLDNGGQKGPQIDILLPGRYRLNTKLFEVTIHEATVIPDKKVGLVTAQTGLPLPESEYVAAAIDGHKNFQNGASFLERNGQRGPQFDYLKPGTYYINPLMFTVELEDVLNVDRGQVAVIVSSIGDDPTQNMQESVVTSQTEKNNRGLERYVVPNGYRGIQREVLGPGSYYLNKLAYTPYIIPTTNITIDWASDTQDKGILPSRTPRIQNPLSIVSKDGFEMTVEVKVIIRILPEHAPMMLARIGTVENLIEHVIHPLIDSSFRNQASSSEAMKFMQDRHVEQSKAEDHVAKELAKYHVECVSVLICQIKLPERLMETLTSKVVASQQMAMFDAQQEAQGRRKDMEKTKAQAEMQPQLVQAEINVQIAEQKKQQQVILAQGQSESTRLEQEGIAAGVASVGKAEAEKTRAIGEATAEAYRKQVNALGQDSLAMIEIMKQVSAGKIKITPEIFVQSSSDAGGESTSSNVLAAFMASLMKNKSHGDAGTGVDVSLTNDITEERV